MLTDDWLVIGTPRPTLKATKAPPEGRTPQVWIDILSTFGPGTFNDFVRIKSAVGVQSVADRLGRSRRSHLHRFLVLGETDNGDFLTWDSERRASSPVYRFAPRAFEPDAEPIARTARQLLGLLATRNLVFERGPRRPFFVPLDPRARRERRLARAPAARRGARTMAMWLRRIERDGLAEVLDHDGGKDWERCILHAPASSALVRAQHTGTETAGQWQVVVDLPVGVRAGDLRPLLESGDEIGWTDELRHAVVRAQAKG